MKQIEKRLAQLEKKLTKNNEIDSQKLQEFMKSGLFSIACFVERQWLKRELTDEEKLVLGLELYQSETWTVNNLVKILIEVDKKWLEEEKRITSDLQKA